MPTKNITSPVQSQSHFGVLGLPFPEAYGGVAVDILTTMLVMEGLGYGGKDNGLLFALNAQMRCNTPSAPLAQQNSKRAGYPA